MGFWSKVHCTDINCPLYLFVWVLLLLSIYKIKICVNWRFIGGFDVFKSRQVGLFSDHIPFESSNLSTVFLEPKTSGHLQPCDLNVFGPMKQSYRRKLNHQLFEKAKNLEAKVALTEYERIKLYWEKFF